MSVEQIVDGKQYTDASYSIFDPIIRDDSNIEYNYVKIDPTIGANLTSKNNQGDAIEYQYYGKDVYQLSKSYFLMKAVFSPSDDLGFDTGRHSSDVTPINNLAHEAFNDGTIWMGNEEAEKTTNIGHADTICKLVYASSEWGSGQGTDSCWVTDTANSGVAGAALGYADANAYRASEPAILRRERISGSYAATLNGIALSSSYFMVKPPFGLLTGNQGVFKDVSFRIKLNRQGNNFLGVCGGAGGAVGPGPKFVVQEMPFYLCVRKPNLDILFQLEKQLANSIIRYQYTTIKTNSLPIPANNNNLNINLNSYPAKPAVVILAFQNDNRETIYSDYGQFDHYNITELSLRVNDKRLPYEVMRTDFGTAAAPARQYQEPLTYLRELVGHNNYIKGHMISNKNYASNYPIFAFNLRNNNEGIPEPNKINTRLDLNVTFGVPPALGKVHAIFLFDNVLEVTGTSNVAKKVLGA